MGRGGRHCDRGRERREDAMSHGETLTPETPDTLTLEYEGRSVRLLKGEETLVVAFLDAARKEFYEQHGVELPSGDNMRLHLDNEEGEATSVPMRQLLALKNCVVHLTDNRERNRLFQPKKRTVARREGTAIGMS